MLVKAGEYWAGEIISGRVRYEGENWHAVFWERQVLRAAEAGWAAVPCCAHDLCCWGPEMLCQAPWSSSTFWKMCRAGCFLHCCAVQIGSEGLPSRWRTLEKMQTVCSLWVCWNEAFKVAGVLLLQAFQINNTVL